MQGVAVELGVHRHGGDPELASGADDPHGDLATVGDQDLLQHGCQCRVRAVPGERAVGDGRKPSGCRRMASGLDHRTCRRDRKYECRPARRRRPTPRPQRAGSPTTRPPGADGSTALGRRRPAPTCWCRCCSTTFPRGGGVGQAGEPRRGRRAKSLPKRGCGAEVAERRAARRAQAGWDPRPASRLGAWSSGSGSTCAGARRTRPASAMPSTAATCSPRCSPPTTGCPRAATSS